MGIQADMVPGNKPSAVISAFIVGAANYPAPEQVSIIASPVAGQGHRRADAERAIDLCINYARDNNLFTTPGSLCVVTTLDGGKDAIAEISVISDVPAEAFGLAITGTVRGGGDTNIIENAHRQLIEVLRESDQLTVEP